MSGFIQRLLDRGVGANVAPPSASSLARTTSPLAAHDQRMHTPAFRGLGLPFDVPVTDTLPDAGFSLPDDAPVARPSPMNTEPSRGTEGAASPAPRPHTDIAADPGRHVQAATPQFDPIAALRAQDKPRAQDNPTEEKTVVVKTRPPVVTQAEVAPPTRDPVPDTAMPDAPSPAPVALTAKVPARPVAPSVEPPEATPLRPTFWPKQEDFEPTVAPTPDLPGVTAPPPVAPQEPRREQLDVLPVRPPTPMPVVPEVETAIPDVSPAPTIETVEKIVERIVEKPAIQSQQQPTRPRPGPITAESVSKIGALPVRRRVNSIFGMRRL